MAKTVSDNQYRVPILKKGYIKIFFTGIGILIGAVVFLTVITSFPPVPYSDPGYTDYLNLVRMFSAILKGVFEIGLILFAVSTFLGAVVDRNLGDNTKRGMMIATGLALLASVIVFVYPLVAMY